MPESFYRQGLILEHMGKIWTFLKKFIKGIFAVLQKVNDKNAVWVLFNGQGTERILFYLVLE